MNKSVLLLIPFLAAGCVSKSGVQKMIEANNESLITPRISALEIRMDESQSASRQHRDVLIRQYELLNQMSQDALDELRGPEVEE